MYAVIVGGGKVGYYLARDLVYGGHEVVVLETDANRVRIISEELGAVTVRGDGCDVTALEDAGVSRADVVAAVTGDDEINLIACQIAKARFTVPRTVARINNPKNEAIFKKLGVDATVSITDQILEYIQEQVKGDTLVHLHSIRGQGVEIVECKLTKTSPAVGKMANALLLPDDARIALLVRHGEGMVPNSVLIFQPGDELVVVTSLRSETRVREVVLGASADA